MSRRREPLGLGLLGLVSPIVVLCIWELASRLGWTNPVLLPSPSQIVAALFALIASGAIASPLAHTVGLFAVGYALAVLIGVGLGIAMATSRTLYGLLEPLVEIVRPIPKPALVPVLFLFLGIGKATMITLVVLASVFPVLISTYQGVRGLDPVLLETARTLQVSRARTILSVILPASLPGCVSHSASGWCWSSSPRCWPAKTASAFAFSTSSARSRSATCSPGSWCWSRWGEF
jgi:ABC-type nitrate/sulfonate/bicarbonate transport system permease component